MNDYRIEISPHETFTPTRAMRRLMQRVDDPQDLEDGLLAVEVDAAREEMCRDAMKTVELLLNAPRPSQ